jgi:hypothetical protein
LLLLLPTPSILDGDNVGEILFPSFDRGDEVLGTFTGIVYTFLDTVVGPLDCLRLVGLEIGVICLGDIVATGVDIVVSFLDIVGPMFVDGI